MLIVNTHSGDEGGLGGVCQPGDFGGLFKVSVLQVQTTFQRCDGSIAASAECMT